MYGFPEYFPGLKWHENSLQNIFLNKHPYITKAPIYTANPTNPYINQILCKQDLPPPYIIPDTLQQKTHKKHQKYTNDTY